MILDGKAVAAKVRASLKERVSKLDVTPGLALVLVGNNPASEIYISGKDKACAEVGFKSSIIRLPETSTEVELLEKVNELNNDPSIHGMIVQLPVPDHIDSDLVIDAILPSKDADGFNPINLGYMLAGKKGIVPATPKGIITLIESTGVDIAGKHAVVLGRSNIVGKPVSVLLQQKDCTVTMCHSKTENLQSICSSADILVAAVGKAHCVTSDMIKEGAIVIDVGINKLNGETVGDVDFEACKEKAGFITPVPGGVGPMTVASLLSNTLDCMEMQKSR